MGRRNKKLREKLVREAGGELVFFWFSRGGEKKHPSWQDVLGFPVRMSES